VNFFLVSDTFCNDIYIYIYILLYTTTSRLGVELDVMQIVS
jgi:hypothetical protein